MTVESWAIGVHLRLNNYRDDVTRIAGYREQPKETVRVSADNM